MTDDLIVTVKDLAEAIPKRYDPLTGTTERWVLDEASGTATLITERDLTGLIEDNKQRFLMFDERSRWTSDIHNHVATIPDFLFYRLLDQFGSPRENAKDWKRWLNDPDNRAFRTRPGKV